MSTEVRERVGDAEERVVVIQNISFTRILTAMLSAKRIVLLCAVVGAILGGLYALRLKPYYVASTQFLTPQLRIGPSITLAGAGGGVGDLNGLAGIQNAFVSRSQADTFSVLMAAWPLTENMVKRLDLAKRYGVSPLAARGILMASTKTVADKGFVTLSVTDSDPNRAALIANGYIDGIREFIRGMALTEASQRRAFYENQLVRAKDELASSEAELQAVQKKTHLITADTQTRLALDTATQLRSRINTAEVELQRLRGYLTEQNPQVQNQEASLSALRGQLSQAESGGSGGYTGGGLGNAPEAAVTFEHADRNVKYREAIYDLLMKQYGSAQLDEARDAPLVQVVQPAQVPLGPVVPPRLLYVIAGFVFGLFVGFLFALWRSIRSQMSPETEALYRQVRQAALRW